MALLSMVSAMSNNIKIYAKKYQIVINLGLFLFALAFLLLMKPLVDPQASMDATYYYVMTDQLEKGAGFEEPFIWHHLNKYEKLVHPTDYWMPFGTILFYFARLVFGRSNEVWLNILIWSFLSVAIFNFCLQITKNYFASLVSFMVLAFAGKYLYCILTTDNMVIYACLGFIFFRLLGSQKDRSAYLGVISGLITLTRIEGHIFAFFAFIFQGLKTRNLRSILLMLLLFVVTLSPWLIRNKIALGDCWPLNSQGLFIRHYNEIFYEDFVGNLEHYLGLGYKTIIKQKLAGLWISLLQIFAVPGIFFYYPLWFLGLIVIWNKDGKYFSFLLVVFWLLCGLLFTIQAARGTTMHISTFFLPHFAAITGIGLDYLNRQKKLKRRFYYGIGIFVIFWSLSFSIISCIKQGKEYDSDNNPYKECFKKVVIPKNETVVSTYPIYTYHHEGCSGVISFKKTGPEFLAEKYKCNYILMDDRLNVEVLPNPKDWLKIYEKPPINLYKRKKPF
jgi:hypothetical protein